MQRSPLQPHDAKMYVLLGRIPRVTKHCENSLFPLRIAWSAQQEADPEFPPPSLIWDSREENVVFDVSFNGNCVVFSVDFIDTRPMFGVDVYTSSLERSCHCYFESKMPLQFFVGCSVNTGQMFAHVAFCEHLFAIYWNILCVHLSHASLFVCKTSGKRTLPVQQYSSPRPICWFFVQILSWWGWMCFCLLLPFKRKNVLD